MLPPASEAKSKLKTELENLHPADGFLEQRKLLSIQKYSVYVPKHLSMQSQNPWNHCDC